MRATISVTLLVDRASSLKPGIANNLSFPFQNLFNGSEKHLELFVALIEKVSTKNSNKDTNKIPRKKRRIIK